MVIDAPSRAHQLVLDLDPALGADLAADDREKARLACRGSVIRIGRGRWELPAGSNGAAGNVLAFVVVDGMLSRETLFGDHVMFELLGATDVVRAPATADGALRGGRATLTAVTESVLLALGTSFVRATAQWPALMTAILDRLEAQRARVAIQGLIMHFPRAEDRLLLTLWHLGGRWGFPNGRGTVVPLPLTHAFLGWLTAASRPTVTVAVRMLEADGLVERLDDGSWLLREAVEQKVAQLSRPHVPHPLGEWLMVRHLHSDTAQASRALIAEAEQLSRRTQAIRARSLPD